MYTHILKNYLNFNYGRSYDSHPIMKKKIYRSNEKRKGVKEGEGDKERLLEQPGSCQRSNLYKDNYSTGKLKS